jgi:hypothetical protein
VSLNHVLLWRVELVKTLPICLCAWLHTYYCLRTTITVAHYLNFCDELCEISELVNITNPIVLKVLNWTDSYSEFEPILRWDGLICRSKVVWVRNDCERPIQSVHNNIADQVVQNNTNPSENKKWYTTTRTGCVWIFAVNVEANLVAEHVEWLKRSHA